MRIWVVQGGYGIWVVRAPSEDAAITMAMAGSPEHTGGAEYGHERDEMTADEVPVVGESEILGSHYG